MSQKRSTKVQSLTEGTPWKLILAFALPMIVGNIFQQAYVMCDTLIVGRFVGVQALAAVGGADWFNWLVLGSVIGFTQGFSIMIAQRFGAEDYVGLRRTIASSIRLSILLALVFGVVAQLLIVPVLTWMRTPREIFKLATLYLRILFAGIPIVVAYNTAASILRSLGNSRLPLIAMVVASLVNIVLDIVMILVFHMGVAGAAVATVFAQLIAFFFCFNALRRVPFLHLEREDWAEGRKDDKALLKLGVPISLQNLIISIGGLVLQGIVNGFGVLFIAGYTATNKIFGLMDAAGVSYGSAVGTYTSQNLGAKKLRRIRSGVRQGAVLGLVTAVAITAVMIAIGRPLLSLFISGTPEEAAETLRVALKYLHFMAILLPVLYMLYHYRSALQGLGDTFIPMISGIVELAVRVSVAGILCRKIGGDGIFWAEIMAWAGAAVLLYITYQVRMHRMPTAD